MSSFVRYALLCVAPASALTGCLVSFNDYPLGDLGGGGSAGQAGTESILVAGAGKGGAVSGGASGAGGTNGASGSSGSSGGDTSPVESENLIDDFEDSDRYIIEQEGRSGSWYVINDGRGQQAPRADQPVLPALLDPPRNTSRRALHTSGGPFTVWGALIGTSLSISESEGLPYDLSPYRGLRVWVRAGSQAPGIARSVRLNLPTPATTEGGNDHFGMEIPLTSEWRRVEVPFASLEQLGFGAPLPSVELEEVLAVHFLFERNLVFDLWVDDIELY